MGQLSYTIKNQHWHMKMTDMVSVELLKEVLLQISWSLTCNWQNIAEEEGLK